MNKAQYVIFIFAILLMAKPAQAQPVDYTQVCDLYGAAFFYSPGSDTCIQAETGETRREDISGTVYGKTGNASKTDAALAEATSSTKRAYQALGGAMVAAAMPTAVVNPGHQYAIAANFSSFAGFQAFGVSSSFTLPATGLALTMGAGQSLDTGSIGTRMGLSLAW